LFHDNLEDIPKARATGESKTGSILKNHFGEAAGLEDSVASEEPNEPQRKSTIS
jgi:hypothetical protein